METNYKVEDTEGCNNKVIVGIEFSDGSYLKFDKHIPKNKELEKYFLGDFLIEIGHNIKKFVQSKY